ncbi:MAG: efflux transporter outer membrane subunit [Candidatus Methylomirabilia bacterium]
MRCGVKRWCLVVVALALTGCASLAPNYTRPAAPVPESWPGGPTATAGVDTLEGAAVADIPWKEFYVEVRLQQLIALALENNRDLRVALLNIERSQAQFQIQRATLLPKVDATAGGNLQGLPEDFSGTGQTATLHQYSLGLGFSSYELDLFGRVRNLKEQALEQYLATGLVQRSARISLVSQVAGAYLALAADRERLQLARETLSNQQESYRLTRSRFAAGVSSALDVNQAQTIVDAVRVDIARYTTLAAQDENALNLVVGSAVADELLPQTLSGTLTALRDFAPGLPSDVLLSRPDILQAESRLKGAHANIGAARAALFPRIALTTSVGLGSNELGGLFAGGAFSWKFAPQISLPIFDGGGNRANLKVAGVDREIAVALYEKAIQTAFREAADALAQRATIDDQLAAQQSLADAAAESHRLSRARYDKGVDSYLAVLDSQRALYAARQSLITTRLSRLVNLATLYKVLGGGAGE